MNIHSIPLVLFQSSTFYDCLHTQKILTSSSPKSTGIQFHTDCNCLIIYKSTIHLKHHLPQQVSVSVGNISIVLSDCVRTLGVEIDASLSMSGQVTALCKSLNFHLYNISRVRKMLTKDACSHAIRSLVLSRLDYSNSLLINVSKMDIGRLQRIQIVQPALC